MHDSRSGERSPFHLSMKAPPRQTSSKTPSQQSHHSQHHSHSHGHGRSHSIRSAKSPKPSSTTPAVSPRQPFSVGQSHPPQTSPRHAQDARPSSPNYFGLVVDSAEDSRGSSGMRPNDWSPASSSIKSFAAAIPKPVSLDANPEFEAFKRAADLNRGKSFTFATSCDSRAPPNPAPARPRPSRWHTHSSEVAGEGALGRSMANLRDSRPVSRMDIDQDSMHDSAYVSADSKRNSQSSLLPPSGPITGTPGSGRTNLTRSEDRDPRLSVMEHRPEMPPPLKLSFSRASTLPSNLDPGQPSMINAQQLKDMIKDAQPGSLLVLDIRSSQNFAQSRIQGALNLCIPTTLLKRATFNIQKLQQTFQSGPDGAKFAKWKDADSIVVYDSHSSESRDAVTAQNMIKKFTNEGYSGSTHILRGGFTQFKDVFPKYVDERSAAEMSGGKRNHPGSLGGLAPVIGGVMMPTTQNDHNPFFSNIRQNMDLADGVGQLDIARPNGLESPSLPRWLRDAAATGDHGKKVSKRFYNIEREEQSRMKSAYGAFNPKNPVTGNEVQLSGVEKGVKNRYKDILPFEHARVKLQKPPGSCDYINASHIQASRSNKRYIATQGPLPATFEDFWSVIWEQDVRVIVMLTAESEGGQLKCHPYWKGRDHGSIRLKLLSEKKASLDIDKHRADSHATPGSGGAMGGEMGRRRANTTTSLDHATPSPMPQENSDAPYVIIRKFALSHTSHPFAPMREITHLHFPSWPDFGTPAQPAHLLALVELANVMQRAALPIDSAAIMGHKLGHDSDALPMSWFDEPEAEARARPMLVHCSAGCGRTGTFCTVDSVIDMLKRRRQARISTMTSSKSDGDVQMTGVEEAISPRATQFDRAQQEQPQKRRKSGSETIDTAWMNDDSIDLIYQTVEDFRSQRLSMVQSLRQFVLCYETTLEWVNRVNERTRSTPSTTGRARSGSLRFG
jgi:protein tyrosine phosphatase/rhodanese-related sulfurtransferase